MSVVHGSLALRHSSAMPSSSWERMKASSTRFFESGAPSASTTPEAAMRSMNSCSSIVSLDMSALACLRKILRCAVSCSLLTRRTWLG
eukprot:scaffold26205_cov69-Phaeocystis_antarctica.AAC.9